VHLYIAIFLGGCLGAVARYSVSLWIEDLHRFPYETLSVNLLGCFILTYFVSHPFLSSKLSRPIKVGLGTGLIGSFTTFSTFATETIDLWMNQEQLLSLLYVLTSIVGGFLFSWLGFKTGSKGEHAS